MLGCFFAAHPPCPGKVWVRCVSTNSRWDAFSGNNLSAARPSAAPIVGVCEVASVVIAISAMHVCFKVFLGQCMLSVGPLH